MRQGGGESVEAQPPERGAPEAAVLTEEHPSGDFPWRDQVTLVWTQLEPGG